MNIFNTRTAIFTAAVCCISVFNSCKKNGSPASPPLSLATVTTSVPNMINQYTCVSGGNVVNDGGDSILERGICYNTQPAPTISNNKIISGSGTGIFVSTLTNLVPNTSFYIRAYAKNSVGIAYGEEKQIQTQPIDSARFLFIGGKNQLYCFNGKNGKLLWSKSVGTGNSLTTPCYSKGIVYAMSYESVLYAFDTTGLLKWSASTGASAHEISSPLVYNNTVFINSNNKIQAFNAATGTLKWQFTPPNGYYVIGSLSLANNTIYANYNGLAAFNPDTGALLWSSYVQNRNTKPKIQLAKAYGVFDYQLNVINASNGSVLSTTGFISTANPLAINAAYGNIYLYKEDGLRVYDELTGALKWSKGGSSLYYTFLSGGSAPVIRDSLVHLVSGGAVSVYNAFTGTKISGYGSNINDANVTVINNISFYGTRDIFNSGAGRVYATAMLPDGTITNTGWISNVSGDFTTTPCVVTDSDKTYRGGDDY
ncbi:MAG: PQQ-binding-like beta-propeller repeat protein [Ferruginibacter sp.]